MGKQEWKKLGDEKNNQKSLKRELLETKVWIKQKKNKAGERTYGGTQPQATGILPLLWDNLKRHDQLFLLSHEKVLFKRLNQRSQKKSFGWNKFNQFLFKLSMVTSKLM